MHAFIQANKYLEEKWDFNLQKKYISPEETGKRNECWRNQLPQRSFTSQNGTLSNWKILGNTWEKHILFKLMTGFMLYSLCPTCTNKFHKHPILRSGRRFIYN